MMMGRRPTDRLRAYGLVAGFGLLLGLGLARTELVVLAAAPLVVLVAGLLRVGDRRLEVAVEVGSRRALEGDTVAVGIELHSPQRLRRLSLLPGVPGGLSLDEEQGMVVDLEFGSTRSVEFLLRCERWGAYRVLDLDLAGRDMLGLFEFRTHLTADHSLRVFPRVDWLRQLFRPLETGFHFGDLVSRQRGTGLEFADLRAYAPGDDPRHINWRVSARAAVPWVNERHPERHAELVVVVDVVPEPWAGAEEVVDAAVRAAAAVVEGHLGRRDRVGLVALGGTLQWLSTGMGDAQRYRVLDMLVAARSAGRRFWAATPASALAHVLPPHGLLLVVSPLLDEEVVGAIGHLRRRGFDVVVLEVDPEPFVVPAETDEQALARRVWELQRGQTRRMLEARGVAVGRWSGRGPLEPTIEEVGAFRRSLLAR